MADHLHATGALGGSLGTPGNTNVPKHGNPLLTPIRVQARPGTALGAAGLALARGTFLNNLRAVVGHTRRLMGRDVGSFSADASGAPEPTGSGWDGLPLNDYGKK